MSTDPPTTHGGRRPGAGRKPTLKPLALIRLLDPEIRAALVELTAHQRASTGNAHLSQEQVVVGLIRAAADAHQRPGQPVSVLAPADQAAVFENHDNQEAASAPPKRRPRRAIVEKHNNQAPSAPSLPTAPAAPLAEITGVLLRSGTSHYLGQPGKTFCGKPVDHDEATWSRDPAFRPTCRQCQRLFRPVVALPTT
jgi:hypothetical protein